MNTTTPDERSEKDGLAREPRELSSEELESIIGGNIPLKGYAGGVGLVDADRLKGYAGGVGLVDAGSA